MIGTLPTDFGVDPAPGTSFDRTSVRGGTPPVRVDLDPLASVMVDALLRGARIDELANDGIDPAVVARRLIDLDLATPRPEATRFDVGRIAGVIPAKDASGSIGGAIDALSSADEIIVVDDGSTDDTAAVARAAGARVIGRPTPGGPGSARNLGAAACNADVLVFLDADAVAEAGWLEPLLAHLADPAAGGAAPRIASVTSKSLLGRYEQASSALDLGTDRGLVRPRGRITFVSSTALVVRREAFDALGGFDESLRFGEDLDLVWRLAAADHPVVYEPRSIVRHHHRASLRGHLINQFRYASASGPLDARHGLPRAGAAPAVVSAGAVAWVSGARRTGGLLAAAGLARRWSDLTGIGIAPGEAAAATARSGAQWLRSLAASFTRPWLPAAATIAVAAPRTRLPISIAVAGRWLALASRRQRWDDVGSWLVVRALEDLAHSSGTIDGCVRSKRAGPLLPGTIARPTQQRSVLGREVLIP